MNHLINSLKVEMQCPNEGMAFSVRHHFAQNMQAGMVEVMEEICTKHSAENEWLRIDKMEIDVGRFDNTVFDKNFKHVFAKQFEKILLGKISNIPLADKQDTQIKSLAEAVGYFLLNGVLPWWTDKNDFDFNDAVVNFLSDKNDAAKLFFNLQKSNQQVWERAAMQLNNAAKETIIQYFVALQQAQQMSVGVLQSVIKTIDKTLVFDAVFIKENINNVVLKAASKFLAVELNESVAVKVLLNGINEIIANNNSNFKVVLNELIKKIKPLNDIADVKNTMNGIKENLIELNPSKQNDGTNEIEEYFVRQAGIVLLSPFYKPFFTNLKLLEAGKWISKEAQIKGVHLLYFVSTGLLEVPEYNVTLEKVLCGFPISFPIPLKAGLTQAEMDECNSLITSAIAHWDVLKATSVKGFRQTFLQREGILKPKESSWFLQVERKTLDVLLEKIPWGFNTIFLPWLPKLVNVEW